MLPFARAIGVRRDEFWHMTMRDWNAEIEGYKRRREIEDEQAWMNGQYTTSAVITGVEHVMAGRKAKSKYIEKPLMQQIADQKQQEELTDEEKKRSAEQLFMKLKVMQSNFEMKKKREEMKKDKEEKEGTGQN